MYTKETFTDTTKYPWFNERYNSYEPKQEALVKLNAVPPYEIIVFGGTWCSDTRYLLPKFYKVMDALQYPPKITLIMVDEQKKSGTGIEANYSIEYVPTFIVLQNGKEKGRVVESVQASIEEDLAVIVSGS